MRQSHIIGSILGTAVGDAIGLPYEGLSPHRATRLLGLPNRHRFLWKLGMVSDDTEHTCMVAQALMASGGDPLRFQCHLARLLQIWLLLLPAGIGWATLRSIVRLWFGVSPEHSGVFSAGNGPAMRAAILGVALHDVEQLREFVRISTRITHRDPKADYGAFAIAFAAHWVCVQTSISGTDFLQHLAIALGSEADELLNLLHQVVDSVTQNESTIQFAARLGLANGVSGYVYHSVPIAIHAWLTHPYDFRSAIMASVECGGDTDSIAAMVGGIVGAAVGKEQIPPDWLNRIWEPVGSISWMEQIAIQLDISLRTDTMIQPIQSSYGMILLRNIGFFLIVLCHGFRRLLPPY